MGDDDPVVALLTPSRILAGPLVGIAFIGMVRVVTGKVHPLREWLVDTGKGHIHPRFEAPGLSEAPSLMLIFWIAGILGVSAILPRQARRW